jgi:rhodanese-related sulfurtransferase
MATRPESIDVETAREYFDEARAQFVDARPAAEWAASHDQIPGAIHVPAGSTAAIDEALVRLPRERLLIAYCDEPAQAASAYVARRAREIGLGDAVFLEGGYRAWKEADQPIAPTPHAPELERRRGAA